MASLSSAANLICSRGDQQDAIKRYVSGCANFDQLLPILRSLRFEKLKEIVVEQLLSSQADADTVARAYCCTASLNDILPDLALERILSFDDFEQSVSNKKVSTQWRGACQQVWVKADKERKLQVAEYERTMYSFPPFDCDENQTWVVDQHTTPLTREELARNFRGPLPDFQSLVLRMRNDIINHGDRVLMKEGEYFMTRNDCFIIDRDVQFVGMGRVRVMFQAPGFQSPHYNSLHTMFQIKNRARVTFDNVEFAFGPFKPRFGGEPFNWYNCVGFSMSESSVLLLRSVMFYPSQECVSVEQGCKFFAVRSRFVRNINEHSAIKAEVDLDGRSSQVHIVGCSFEEFIEDGWFDRWGGVDPSREHSQSCIEISLGGYVEAFDNLMVIGNIFSKNRIDAVRVTGGEGYDDAFLSTGAERFRRRNVYNLNVRNNVLEECNVFTH